MMAARAPGLQPEGVLEMMAATALAMLASAAVAVVGALPVVVVPASATVFAEAFESPVATLEETVASG